MITLIYVSTTIMWLSELMILLIIGVLRVCHGNEDPSSDVYNSVLENYNPALRPNCGDGSSTQVKIGIAVRQILELDEPSQILTTNIWVRLSWNDCRLKWNTTSGVSSLTVPYKQIWTPDITLYDNADNVLGGAEDYRASIYPDGSVYYYFPSVVASLCKMDVTYFPYDTQICPLKLGSWAYFGNELNLTLRDGETSADASTYKENGEWEIAGAPAVRHVTYYSCCVHPFPDVTFYVTLKRRPRFYLLSLMFPCILMSSMAVLGFLLPPDSGEKVSLEITVLLSLSVFMLVVSESMPPTSETFPYIGLYFTSAMVLVSWSCLMTVTVLNLHHRGGSGRRLPAWVRKVFLKWIARILFAQPFHKDDDENTNVFFKRNKVEDSNVFSDEVNITDLESKIAVDDEFCNDHFVPRNRSRRHSSIKNIRRKSMFAVPLANAFVMNNRNNPISTEDSRSEEMRVVKLQLQCIESIHDYLNRQKQFDEVAEEWQNLAKVLDRVFMILFFVFQLSTTVFMMVKVSGDH